MPEDESRLLLATGRFIGEGFDDARLDTLFLTLPVSWRGIIAQYAGRLHRLHDRKREVRIYDYADLNVQMLAKMFECRCQGYGAIGYTVQLPSSAIPLGPSKKAEVSNLFSSRVNIVGIIAAYFPTGQTLIGEDGVMSS